MPGDVGNAAKLVARHDPGGEPEPAHVRVLRGGDVKEPEVLRHQDINALGVLPIRGARSEFIPAVERKLLPLRLLLGAEFLPLREEPALCLVLKGFRPQGARRPRGHGGRRQDPVAGEGPAKRGKARGAPGQIRPRDEPLKVLSLFLGEPVVVHHSTLASLMRRACGLLDCEALPQHSTWAGPGPTEPVAPHSVVFERDE